MRPWNCGVTKEGGAGGGWHGREQARSFKVKFWR
jgi:hypothetical protein